MAGPLKRPGHGTLDLSTSPEMSGSEGGGVAVSLNRNPLPRVDEAANGLRERQRSPGIEEFTELIAILPRQAFGGWSGYQPSLAPSAC
jgi:hypothetical protein